MNRNIIHLVSNRVWGGGERYVLDLCKALEADGDSVAVITRGKKEVDRRFIDAGFTPGHLPLKGILDFISPTSLAHVLNRISSSVIIHVHNFKDADIAIRARKICRHPENTRIVLTRHLARPAKTGRHHRGIYRALDAIIFVSEAAKAEFLSSAPHVDHNKLHVLHNAIIPPESITHLAKDNGEIRLVFAGRLTAEKGLDVLIEALAKSNLRSRIKLKIAGVGQGREVMPLMALARRLDVDHIIEWLGPLDNVYPLIASADIGLLPSVVNEACPLAPIEFMSQGIPVIATDCGGTSELISDGVDGLLVKPGDSQALADAIDKLASDANLRAQMGQNAAESFINKHSYSHFFDAIREHYDANER